MYNKQHLNKVRVWDLPTRLFHWALALGVICLAVSGLIGGNAMVWHFRFGYAVLSLLLFRVCGDWWAGAGRALAHLFTHRKASSTTSRVTASRSTLWATAPSVQVRYLQCSEFCWPR